jgi:hypothetical protein
LFFMVDSFKNASLTMQLTGLLFNNQKLSIMKKILFATAILVASASYAAPVSNLSFKSGGGIHISASQVPLRILNAFKAAYPTARRVEWEKEIEHGIVEYKVEFYINGSKMKARYY